MTGILWILLGVAVALSGPSLWLIFQLGPNKSGSGENQMTSGTKRLTFGEMVLYMMGPILGQSVPLFLR